MGKDRKGKCGHKANKPVSLHEQINNEKYPKPSQRVKSRDKKNDSSKQKAVNITGVLSQLRLLENECIAQELKETPENKDEAEGIDEEDEEEEFMVPEHMDAVTNEFKDNMNVNLNTEEEQIYASFMSQKEDNGKSYIAQMREALLEQHNEIKTEIDAQSSVGGPVLDDKVVKMLEEVAVVLNKYRSGPLPKIVKVMPKHRNWIHLLYHTNPDGWSAAAMYMITRIYKSEKPEMAQVFYSKVLLPRLRDDIAQYKKLNTHLYRALGEALFKSAAFFKGIILPLCLSNDCTLREAVIFGSLLARKKIPMLASAAAIRIIAGLKYTGANSIFLRVLINKKHSLPWSVIDSLVLHFVRFKTEEKKLPVLWHQCLLTFVQRFKEDLSSDQKKELYGLAAYHSHKTITPEVRRELENSKCRHEK